MIKLGLFVVSLWVGGFIILTYLAFSRWLFDDPPPPDLGMNKHELFFARLFVAAFWWLMLLSAGGRRGLIYLITGEVRG